MAHPRSGVASAITLGIDLGTTHTVVAHNGSVLDIAPGESRSTLLASAVAFPPSGERLVGWDAKRRRAIDPLHTLLSTKRLIGAPHKSPRAKRYAEHHPFEMVDSGGLAALKTRGGAITPGMVATDLLRAATGGAAQRDGHGKVVITVPAAFESSERRATLRAGEAAGFRAPLLIEEPVATAIAYLDRSNIRYGAVYDLGGGTFDVALVDCSRYPFRVVAYAGNRYLGGDDVDRVLAQRVAAQVLKQHRWDLMSDAATFARLVSACETAKVQLSTETEAVIELAEVDPAGPWEAQPFVVEREQLAPIVRDLVMGTFVIVDHVLHDGGVTVRDVDAVFLAGGSTSLPGMREMVGSYFGKRARADLDPMHVVALGASLAAARPNLADLLGAEGCAA